MTETTLYLIDLPWPPAELSPNRRQHWARHAKAKAHYRAACRLVAEKEAAAGNAWDGFEGPLELHLVFQPPNRRAFDRDNLLARMKAGLDGLCDVLGFDDSRFVSVTVRVGEWRPGGVVQIRIQEASS